MSLSDCIRCWSTPCECGWEYRNWPIEELEKHAQIFLRIIEFKKRATSLNFSTFLSEPETDADKRLMEYIRTWKKTEQIVKGAEHYLLCMKEMHESLNV